MAGTDPHMDNFTEFIAWIRSITKLTKQLSQSSSLADLKPQKVNPTPTYRPPSLRIVDHDNFLNEAEILTPSDFLTPEDQTVTAQPRLAQPRQVTTSPINFCF